MLPERKILSQIDLGRTQAYRRTQIYGDLLVITITLRNKNAVCQNICRIVKELREPLKNQFERFPVILYCVF